MKQFIILSYKTNLTTLCWVHKSDTEMTKILSKIYVQARVTKMRKKLVYVFPNSIQSQSFCFFCQMPVPGTQDSQLVCHQGLISLVPIKQLSWAAATQAETIWLCATLTSLTPLRTTLRALSILKSRHQTGLQSPVPLPCLLLQYSILWKVYTAFRLILLH